MTETEKALLARIESLEARLPASRVSLPPGEPVRRKPTSPAAYQKALNAFVSGNRKPLTAYLAMYRVPGT